MIQQTMLMHYHLPRNTTFEQQRIQLFLTDLANEGYSLATFSQPGVFGITKTMFAATSALSANTADHTAVDLPATLQKDLASFASGKRSSLWILALSREQNSLLQPFKWSIAFRNVPATLSLAVTLENIAFATNKKECARVFEQWLTLFRKAYEVWRPFYAHSVAPGRSWPEPRDEALAAGSIPYLYEVNFLGPALVERLGQKRVMSTPAWKMQPLANGGILLVPECIFADRDPHIWENAIQHLEMRQALWCRYVPVPRPTK